MNLSKTRLIGAAGVAAIGLLAGMAIGRAKKTAVKAHMLLSGDWERQLKSEHRAVKALLRAMVAPEAGATARAALLEQVADALTRHAVEEENVVYPALKAVGAPAEARQLFAEHAEMKTMIRDLKELNPDDPRWTAGATALKDLIYRHVREEENELFPLLHEIEGDDRNQALTKMMQKEGVRVTG